MRAMVVGRHFAALATASAATLSVGAAGADAESQRRAHDAQVTAEVAAVSAEAAAAFAEGDAARERGDLAAAARGYDRARTLAPRSSHPLRRLCWAEGGMGDREAALSHCRQAVSMEASAANLGALAMALMVPPAATVETPRADRVEALQLAQRAARVDATDVNVHIVMCQAALSLDDIPALRQGAARLASLAPEQMMTHYFAAIVHGVDKNWTDANAALDRAEAAGLPKPEVLRLRQILHDAQPFWARLSPATKVAWVAATALLAVGSWLLGRRAMRALAKRPRDKTGRA